MTESAFLGVIGIVLFFLGILLLLPLNKTGRSLSQNVENKALSARQTSQSTSELLKPGFALMIMFFGLGLAVPAFLAAYAIGNGFIVLSSIIAIYMLFRFLTNRR